MRRHLDTPRATANYQSEKGLSARSRQGPSKPTTMKMKDLEAGSTKNNGRLTPDQARKGDRGMIVAETTVSIESSPRLGPVHERAKDIEYGSTKLKISSPIPIQVERDEIQSSPAGSTVYDDTSSQTNLVLAPEPVVSRPINTQQPQWDTIQRGGSRSPPLHLTHDRIQGMVRGQPTAMYNPHARASPSNMPNWPLQ